MRGRGLVVQAEPETANRTQIEVVRPEHFGDADLVISFGGDGTLIRAAHLVAHRGTPILGVYYGRFGFVTQCDPHELGAAVSDFIDGKSRIEPRMMLQTRLLRKGEPLATLHCLNETVLQRSVTVRMMMFTVSVDDRVLTTYPADGVLVSTPTGSTGYNLSAGGPIMDPMLEAITVTALAPHTLSARSLVLSPQSVIRFSMAIDGEAVLSADGANRLHLLTGDEVEVRRSTRVTNLVCVQPDDFLIKLHDRLFYGHSLVGENS
jgi:NAD+ kinase